jgi:hypothetical protein
MNTITAKDLTEKSLWEAKLEKAQIGEEIIINYIKRDYPDYDILTHNVDKPHWIDIIIMNKENLDIKFIEVKTKEKWRKFDAIGFDVKNYKEYIALQNKTNIDILIYFVEEINKEIRLLKLSEAIKYDDLGKTYTHKPNKTISWFIKEQTKFVALLTDEDCEKLNIVNKKIKPLKKLYDTYN